MEKSGRSDLRQEGPAEMKGNLYKIVVRPATLYGLETVALTRKLEMELEVADLRVL